MPTFFWVAEIANMITATVALAALLIVIWLGPRRWTNISFAAFLTAIILWMANSVVARFIVNFPQLGLDARGPMNIVALGFALIGITLFWFVESFYSVNRWVRLVVNLSAIGVYALFLFLLAQGAVVTDIQRGTDGGIDFGITPVATALSGFQYLYQGLTVWLLVRNAAWRTHLSLCIGALTVIVTTVMAVISPAIALQTFTITIGTLFLTYEVVRQQLFNPLVQLNHHLEDEVARRTAELAQSLEAQERVRSELAAARTIQLSLLPHATPVLPYVHVAGSSVPAKEVGGDFFAYHMFADGRLGVAVGDVSGKGIPAALLMALALNTFETLVDGYDDQGALLAACNNSLASRMVQSKQNTAFLSVVIDHGRAEAQVANAGLIAPLLWRDGAVQYVESYGLPLGARYDTDYHQERIAIQPGDCLLIVSDGIVEAMSPTREIWGFPRLEATFRAHGGAAPTTLIQTILDAVRQFMADTPQHDDMTVVALQIQAV